MRRILFSIAMLLISSTVMAQKKDTPVEPSNELDQKYSPPASSIFNDQTDGSARSMGEVKSLLGFEMCLLTRGVFALSGERIIDKSPVSIHVGLGYVFNKDFLQTAMTSPDYFEAYSSASGTEYTLGNILKNADFSPSHRFFGELGMRYYFNYSGDLDGNYLEFGARWHNYETLLKSVSSTSGQIPYVVPARITTNIKTTTYAVRYGIQAYGSSKRYYSNFYIGLGIRKVEFGGISNTLIENYSSLGGFQDFHELRPNGQTVKGYMPVLQLGWDLEFGL